MNANAVVVLNKVQTIERCVVRARADYAEDPANFATHYQRQDSAILNVLRACEAAIDLAQHILSSESLGVSQSAKDGFLLLGRNGIIKADLSNSLQAMVGFRNVAVHDYQHLDIDKVVYVITHRLDDLLEYGRILLSRCPPPSAD